MIFFLRWAAVPFSILGNEFVVRKMWLGWLFWLISNLLWITVFIALGMWPEVIVFLAYLYYTVRGIRRWQREAREQENR